MGWAVYVLGSAGMLALIGLLAAAFFRKIGVLSKGTSLRLGKCAGITALTGLGYFLFALLVRQAIYSDVKGSADILSLLGGGYLRSALNSLETPGGPWPLTWCFSIMANALGKALFGQYRLAGFALAYCLIIASVFLVHSALKKSLDEGTADNGAFLLLCLPGSAFFFLPCGAPLALLLFSLIFFFALKGKRPKPPRFLNRAYGWVLGISGCLSAWVVYGIACGQIG